MQGSEWLDGATIATLAAPRFYLLFGIFSPNKRFICIDFDGQAGQLLESARRRGFDIKRRPWLYGKVGNYRRPGWIFIANEKEHALFSLHRACFLFFFLFLLPSPYFLSARLSRNTKRPTTTDEYFTK